MTLLSLLLPLAKVTAVLAAAMLTTRLLRNASAGVRHLTWLIALLAVLAVPVLDLLSPVRLAVLPNLQPDAMPSAMQNAMPSGMPSARSNVPPGGASTTAVPTNVVASAASERNPGVGGTSPLGATTASSSLFERANLGGGTALLLLWLGGALAILAWLAQGWFTVRRIVRRAHPITHPAWINPMYEVADRLGLNEAPALVRSADVRMPFACGLAVPTVVLPDSCDGWTLDRRRAVLLHELAHVRRRDLVGHTIARLVCAVYWFHPLVWMAARRLRSESEQACDDLAVGSGARASDYAEHLLDIVTAVRRDRTPNVAMAMARRSEFEGRMLAILDTDRPRRGPTRRQTAALATALGALTLLVGAAAPVPADEAFAVESALVQTEQTEPAAQAAQPEQREPSGRVRANSELGIGTADMLGTLPVSTTAAYPEDAATPEPAASPASPASPAAPMQRLLGGELTDTTTPRSERAALLVSLARNDANDNVRRTAVWGLEDFVEEFATVREALSLVVREDGDPRVRELAAWAMGQGEYDRQMAGALGEALRQDDDESVRITAAWALAQIDANEARPALIEALSEGNERLRIRAAWALGILDEAPAPPELVAMLRDPSVPVRRVATWALRQSDDRTVAPALYEAYRAEQNGELRSRMLYTLRALDGVPPEAVQELLDAGDETSREEAVQLLVGARHPDPWPWPWPDPRPFP